MAITASSTSWLRRRKAARLRRRELREAVRGEWELEPRARGWAAVRAFAQQVGQLEQARLAAHAEAARREPIPRPAESPRKAARHAPVAQRSKRS